MKLTIVGDAPPPAVQALAGDGVEVTGWVPETEPYLASHRISVAPLRFGAGMKGKVGEALAAGLPVVTTSIGAEGMVDGAPESSGLAVADDPQAFADAVVRLIRDDAEWTELAEAGRAHVARHYGHAPVAEALEQLLAAESTRPVLDDLTSIVILAHGELELTRACLDSIAAHTPERHELILVDNGSPDGTAAFLERYAAEHGHVRVVLNRRNAGFAAGCNQGLALSRGDAVLLLNNDTLVTPGWLGRLRRALAGRRRARRPAVQQRLRPAARGRHRLRRSVRRPRRARRLRRRARGRERRRDCAGSARRRLLPARPARRARPRRRPGGAIRPRQLRGRRPLPAHPGLRLRRPDRARLVRPPRGQPHVRHRKGRLDARDDPQLDGLQGALGPAGRRAARGRLRDPARARSRRPARYVPLPALGGTHITDDGRVYREDSQRVAFKHGVEAVAANEAAALRDAFAEAARWSDVHHRYLTRRRLVKAVFDSGTRDASLLAAAAGGLVLALEDNPREPVLLNELGVLFYGLARRPLGRAALLGREAPRSDAAGGRRQRRRRARAGEGAARRADRNAALLRTLAARAEAIARRAVPYTTMRISLCMIVKDEEEMLPRCLAAVAEHVDEIVIVDTGSTDAPSRSPSRSAPNVVSFPWNGSFADARNVSLDHATGDWILWLDADEVLEGDIGNGGRASCCASSRAARGARASTCA